MDAKNEVLRSKSDEAGKEHFYERVLHDLDQLVGASHRVDVAINSGQPADIKDLNLISSLRSQFLHKDNLGELSAFFSGVTHACFDVDGTITREGFTNLPEDTIEAFRLLQSVGVEITVGPTGKPLKEIEPLLNSIPSDVKVGVIYEKGSFRLDETGVPQLLLMSEDERVAMNELSALFYGDKRDLNGEFGFTPIARRIKEQFGVEIVPAGSGEHTNLSFDVLQGGSRIDWWNFTNEDRKALKLSAKNHQSLFESIEGELRLQIGRCIDQHSKRVPQLNTIRNFRYVDLGQGNIEITAPSVEKDRAVEAYIVGAPNARVVVVGDSKNDMAMLALNRNANVHSCLVLHGPQAKALVPLVDSVVFGEANAARVIYEIVTAKRPVPIPRVEQ